ncbi:DUF5652 family protein [Patescibacteria group bacterium]
MELLQENFWVLPLLAAWVIPWKGVALWKASRLGQKWWFVIMLVFNTLAILEIFYIFFIARKKSVEIVKKEN